MAAGMQRKPRIIMDRREAIAEALKLAQLETAKENSASSENSVAVLITGKGTDPYIMLANGEKQPWSDAQVVREELEKLLS
jgi:UDP-N-acetylmuramyl tripeptide synthase